jgi:hypothetical protein
MGSWLETRDTPPPITVTPTRWMAKGNMLRVDTTAITADAITMTTVNSIIKLTIDRVHTVPSTIWIEED